MVKEHGQFDERIAAERALNEEQKNGFLKHCRIVKSWRKEGTMYWTIIDKRIGGIKI